MEGKRPDPQRLNILKSLPKEVVQSLSREEVSAIMYEEVWPDSLQEKLKDYLVGQG